MSQEKDKKQLLKLFVSTFTISAFTFGGGYVIVPLMKKKFSTELGWFTEDEMTEYVAMAQASPGAMALNCATLVGWKIGGLPGALCGLLGTALPPFLILSLVYLIYDSIRDNTLIAAAIRGMQAGIAAVIADVVYGMARPFVKKEKLSSMLIMIAAFAATWFFGVNVAFIVLAGGLIGALMSVWKKHKEDKAL